MKITKFPPGEAQGARDLQTWSSRRAAGRTGVPCARDEPKPDAADRWLAKHELSTKHQRRRSRTTSR
jgi:hypothetical protein